MRRYFKNLLLAIAGYNPYRLELDEKSRQLDLAGENLGAMQEQYYTAKDKWMAAEKESARLQQLVENLRQSISDKDEAMSVAGREFHELMERMKAGYQKRIDGYTQKIDELQKLLPQT